MNPLNIWIWRDYEPVPTDPGSPRLMRAGMLSQLLAEKGHKVRWFNSTFDHYGKRQRNCGPGSFEIANGLTLELVAGLGYSSNGSPKRLIHNFQVARNARKRGDAIVRQTGERPDIIVADIPVPEMALAATRLAARWGIPSIVSIRDLWPDFFKDFLPSITGKLALPILWNMDRTVRSACAQATSIVGISSAYLAWGLEKAGRAARKTDVVLPLGYYPIAPASGADAIEQLRAKKIDPTRSLVIFVGSWGRTYNLSLILDAAEMLADRTDIQFVIGGGGEQLDMVASRAATLPNVICPGWLDRSEIATLLSISAVGLAPYGDKAPQGLPNKLFEYMSAGLFQITTLGGEARTMLHGHGLGRSVDSSDKARLSPEILAGIEIMSEPGKRQGIREHFDANFHAQKIYAEYERHIVNLAGTTSSGRPKAQN